MFLKLMKVGLSKLAKFASETEKSSQLVRQVVEFRRADRHRSLSQWTQATSMHELTLRSTCNERRLTWLNWNDIICWTCVLSVSRALLLFSCHQIDYQQQQPVSDIQRTFQAYYYIVIMTSATGDAINKTNIWPVCYTACTIDATPISLAYTGFKRRWLRGRDAAAVRYGDCQCHGAGY